MATLAFQSPPAPGTTLLLTATVLPVQGETDKSNNTLKFLVDFSKS
jgi:hypothetical protein